MQRYQQECRALGSLALITLICESDAQAEALFQNLWQATEVFEQRFSRFLETSELSRINRASGTKTVCSFEMISILKTCEQWGKLTQGVFNPFILPRLVEAGYGVSFETNKAAPLLPRALRVSNIDELKIGQDSVLIPKDSALDLGGIGKGYLLDQLADQLDKQIDRYWLSFGGDVSGRGLDIDDKPWQIGVADASHDDQSMATIRLPKMGRWAVATSGTNRRRGESSGKVWHHLINPATGQPAETDIVTATLVAQSATATDVLASCAVILGSQAGSELLALNGIQNYIFQYLGQRPQFKGDMIQLPKESL
jgi:thiamine biosynthesis lipoprotein